MSFKCPLCSSKDANHHFYQKLHNRDFYQCQICDLVFVDRLQLLDVKTEKSRYDLHQNDIRSEGYESFLRRVINPITNSLVTTAKGLDYGCGPYPMLINIFSEDGFKQVSGYDPIYQNDESVLNVEYDFVTLCEVIEHMNDPSLELKRISKMLKSSALFIISTGIRTEEKVLKTWHYIHDDTHINLFSLKTFKWMEKQFSLKLERTDKDLAIFSKI